MSSFTADNDRVGRLRDLCLGIIRNEKGKAEILACMPDINHVDPLEVISIVEAVIGASGDMDEKKRNLSKILNVLHQGISGYQWEPAAGNLFLRHMMKENSAVRERLNEIKRSLKNISTVPERTESNEDEIGGVLRQIGQLSGIENHYQKKENIFFPHLEKKGGHLQCLPVMWSIHDDVRRHLKQLNELKNMEKIKTAEFFSLTGRLFFARYAMIFREDLILYPAADGILEEELWDRMMEESYDIGFSFIDIPERTTGSVWDPGTAGAFPVDLGTGVIDREVLRLILNTLPLDMTFVDKNDRVAYFSSPSERIFPRSKAVLGRSVRNCHPPESIEHVDRIIHSFRTGASSKESFRIFYKGRYVLIEYYAVRGSSGEYEGVLEVTSDITGIRELTGEKRLSV